MIPINSEIIDTPVSLDSGSGGPPKKYAGHNIQPEEPNFDPTDTTAATVNNFNSILSLNGLFFRGQGQQESDPIRFAIVEGSQHVCFSTLTGRQRVEVLLDVFEPLRGSEPGGRELVEVRRRRVGMTPLGEKIFPQRMIEMWRLCEEFEPDFDGQRRITRSEWSQILDGLAETLNADKADYEAEVAARQRRHDEYIEQQNFAKNPGSQMAAAIAQGVAAAMAEMGLKAKGTK